MNKPSIYVGSYAAYNNGSLHGAWIDLEDYPSHEEFWARVNEIHAEEIASSGEVEAMFQDWQCIPSEFISESWLDPEVWDWLDLDEDDRQLLDVYQDGVDSSVSDIDQIREAYQGKYDEIEDWAAEFLEDTGSLSSVPEALRGYIDFKAYARDAMLGGDMTFVRRHGYFYAFRNY